MRGGFLQVSGIDRRAPKSSLQRGCLLRPVDQADAPVLGELPGQQLRTAGRMGLVDEAEVRLEPVEHRGVGVEQCAIRFEE